MELAYPPFETKDADGNPTGVSVDIAEQFAQYIGKDIRIENIAWGGLIPSLQTGKVDMVISSMTIRDDRLEQVDFSDPYANALLAVLSNKSSGIESVDNLNMEGMKIAIKNGTSGHFYAKDKLANAELVVLDDESACVMEVAQGRADGFIYDQLTIYRNWQKNIDTTSAVFIPFQDAEKWGVAVQKGNSELLGQLNAFIKNFRDEGGYDKVTQKYLADEKAAFDKLGFKWFFDFD
jgi:polar amino acid transport system substrate-binding protein